MMKKILIISMGGTFNKVYNPLNGTLEIDKESHALQNIASKWLCKFEILNLIGKDSLEMTDQDRESLLQAINQSKYTNIIIIHGTDTIDKTAAYLANSHITKRIILTGAMVPFNIEPVEATANLASAYGYINALTKDGVFIAMNGIMDSYEKIKKNHKEGLFTL